MCVRLLPTNALSVSIFWYFLCQAVIHEVLLVNRTFTKSQTPLNSSTTWSWKVLHSAVLWENQLKILVMNDDCSSVHTAQHSTVLRSLKASRLPAVSQNSKPSLGHWHRQPLVSIKQKRSTGWKLLTWANFSGSAWLVRRFGVKIHPKTIFGCCSFGLLQCSEPKISN